MSDVDAGQGICGTISAARVSSSWMWFLGVSSAAKVKLLAELFERFELLKAEERDGGMVGPKGHYETIDLI